MAVSIGSLPLRPKISGSTDSPSLDGTLQPAPQASFTSIPHPSEPIDRLSGPADYTMPTADTQSQSSNTAASQNVRNDDDARVDDADTEGDDLIFLAQNLHFRRNVQNLLTSQEALDAVLKDKRRRIFASAFGAALLGNPKLEEMAQQMYSDLVAKENAEGSPIPPLLHLSTPQSNSTHTIPKSKSLSEKSRKTETVDEKPENQSVESSDLHAPLSDLEKAMNKRIGGLFQRERVGTTSLRQVSREQVQSRIDEIDEAMRKSIKDQWADWAEATPLEKRREYYRLLSLHGDPLALRNPRPSSEGKYVYSGYLKYSNERKTQTPGEIERRDKTESEGESDSTVGGDGLADFGSGTDGDDDTVMDDG